VNAETSRAMTSAMMSGLIGPDSKASAQKPDLDIAMLDGVLRGMTAPKGSRFISPWAGLVGGGEQNGIIRDGYLGSDNGKYLLMQVAPADGADHGPDRSM